MSELGVKLDAREMIEFIYRLGPENVNDILRVRKSGLEENTEEPGGE